jgi:LysM repeat protein
MKIQTQLNKIGIALAFVILFIPQTQAIEYGGVGLLPANPDPSNTRTQSIFVETIKPLESKTNDVLVVNNTEVTKTLLVYAVDSQKSSDGAFACAQYADPKKNVGNWIKLAKSEVTLAPATNEKVPFTITAPENVGVGEENGCIIVQEKESNVAQSAGANLSFRTGVRVAITIPGEQIRNITLERFDIDTKGVEPKLLTKIEAKNSGNTSVDADITLSQGDKELAKNTYPVLRGDTATYNIELDKPYWGGFLEYTTTISYDKSATTLGVDSGEAKEVIKKTIRVFVYPQPPALFAIAGVFALIVISLYLLIRVWSRYRYRRLWTEEYIVGEDEDLESIAEKLGLPWKVMARVNNIKAPYAVEVGQKIKIFPGHLTHPVSLEHPRIAITSAPAAPSQVQNPIIPDPIQPQVSVTTTPESSIESIALDLHLNLDNTAHAIPKSEYTVLAGDSIDNVAKQLGVDWKVLAKANNIEAPYSLAAGQVLHIPAAESVGDEYTVKVGDTIATVAKILGVDWKVLAKANDLEPPYTLTIGQTVTKPKKAKTKSKAKRTTKTKSKAKTKAKTVKKSK